ncbi:MAG TPA: 2-phosphosulfolactate phosphatase [bacterium]|nr:2-phosphosulfolactate phosphatase [bacterium]
MEVHVTFLPEEAGDCHRRAVAVIDVVRTTTSLLVMVERGCEEVLIASSVEAARRYRGGDPGILLAGEQDGRTPEGFDFGNSPAAFAATNLAGERVVFATTNGTRALHLVRSGAVTLIACLRNRVAVAKTLRGEARALGLDVTVVCAGREGRFGLDDAYTAGSIVDAMCAISGSDADGFTDAALAARALFRAYPDAKALLRVGRTEQHVIRLDLADDLRVCAELDQSTVVPRMGERVRLLEP